MDAMDTTDTVDADDARILSSSKRKRVDGGNDGDRADTIAKSPPHKILRTETTERHGEGITNGNADDEADPVIGAGAEGSTRPRAQLPDVKDDVGTRSCLMIWGNVPDLKELFSGASAEQVDLVLETANRSKDGITLPPGMTISHIMPTPSLEDGPEGKPVPLLMDAFPPPAHLAALTPPKPSKKATTRGNVVGWYDPDDPALWSRRESRGSHGTRPLPTPYWLSYGNLPRQHPIGSPVAQRQRRERALSSVESGTNSMFAATGMESDPAQLDAMYDAMFVKAFSSHLPTHDTAGSIISMAEKNMVWWDRVGKHRIDDVLEDIESGNAWAKTRAILYPEKARQGGDVANTKVPHNENGTKAIVEEGRPSETTGHDGQHIPEAEQQEQTTDKVTLPTASLSDFCAGHPPRSLESFTEQDVDDILKDISEGLQTLDSMQRIRMESVTSTTRYHAPPNSRISSMLGTPSVPSKMEDELYHKLEAQLAATIAMLPPWAVARLNSDPLNGSTVSTTRLTQSPTYEGRMGDDGNSSSQASGRPAIFSPSSGPVTNPRGTTAYGGDISYPLQTTTPPRSSAYDTHNLAARTVYPTPTGQQSQYSSGHSAAAVMGGSRGMAFVDNSNSGGDGGDIVYAQPRGSRGVGQSANRSLPGSYSSAIYGGRSSQGAQSRSGLPQPPQYFQATAEYGRLNPTTSGASSSPLQRPSQPQYQQHAQHRQYAAITGSVGRGGGGTGSGLPSRTRFTKGGELGTHRQSSLDINNSNHVQEQHRRHGLGESSTIATPTASGTGTGTGTGSNHIRHPGTITFQTPGVNRSGGPGAIGFHTIQSDQWQRDTLRRQQDVLHHQQLQQLQRDQLAAHQSQMEANALRQHSRPNYPTMNTNDATTATAASNSGDDGVIGGAAAADVPAPGPYPRI